MIGLLALAQSVVTAAPPTSEPRAATSWSCQFNGADAFSFRLTGFFAEAPAGSDPNAGQPTRIEGDGPAFLRGNQQVNVFDSGDQVRSYMVSRQDRDGSRYNLMMVLLPEENAGIATVTRYVPDAATGRGQLHAFATGYCSATFHPIGYKGTGQ